LDHVLDASRNCSQVLHADFGRNSSSLKTDHRGGRAINGTAGSR
jgi:hypothetical protein